ncbi:MAG TPA: plasmid mobilization relaxosome protein MobC [Flavisolibacter sp.]
MTHTQKVRDANRDLIFKLRLTAHEKKTLLELAEQAGMTTSDYVRVKTIGGQPQTRKATPDRAVLIRLQAELNKVGSNANQIARALNRRQDSDSLTGVSMAEINQTAANIQKLLNHIAKELGYGN